MEEVMRAEKNAIDGYDDHKREKNKTEKQWMGSELKMILGLSIWVGDEVKASPQSWRWQQNGDEEATNYTGNEGEGSLSNQLSSLSSFSSFFHFLFQSIWAKGFG